MSSTILFISIKIIIPKSGFLSTTIVADQDPDLQYKYTLLYSNSLDFGLIRHCLNEKNCLGKETLENLLSHFYSVLTDFAKNGSIAMDY